MDAHPHVHPCVRCGACCATYHVLFPVQEIEPDSFGVPKSLTEKVDASTRAMMGTNQQRPRCVALAGKIGTAVECSIYDHRPGCCRKFRASFEDGTRNRRCDHARIGKGLKPLSPKDWVKIVEPEVDSPPPTIEMIGSP